jgi:hypothetical protein
MGRHAALTAALVAGFMCPAILAPGAAAAQQATTTTGLCPTPPPLAAAADAHDLHSGAWSYFGDPRSLAHGTRVFTGCVSTTRGIIVHQYDLRTGESFHAHLHRNTELDDHDNPSLVFWRHRIYAFYSPHSGRVFPLDRHSRMHYRVSRARYDLHKGFGPERLVRTNTPGGLGYTYPNPIATRDKLWLFWRGGNWYPTFSYTRDGVHWVKARTLVRGPHRQRPYAKYIGGPDGSIHVVLSEGHPQSYRTSLYYVRYKSGHFYRADGRLIGRKRDLPLRVRQLDRVYRYRPAIGRAWPHDIALGPSGQPRIVYTAREGGPGGRDTFYLARWDGSAWRRYGIVSAGRGALTFHSGGITFDHARPSRVVLSRTIGGWNEIEVFRTPDGGRTWMTPIPVTSNSNAHNFRPIIPRGLTGPRLVVIYVHGTASSFRNFQTVVRMDVAEEPGGQPRTAPIPSTTEKPR